jgi:transcriptional regulator with XRE-family HTH domain
MELRDILARNVRRRREHLGLTQEEVAHRAGIDRTHVSKIERRVHSPTVEVLGQLAAALDVEPSELLKAGDPAP